MSKNKLIGIAAMITFVSLSVGYVVMNAQIATSPTPEGSIVTMPPIIATNTQPSISPTPSSVITTNTSRVISTSTATKQPTINQISPTMSRLLELINGCLVESISFPPTHGESAKSVKSVILKDGSLFDDIGLIEASDIPILSASIRNVQNKCRIKVGFTIID